MCVRVEQGMCVKELRQQSMCVRGSMCVREWDTRYVCKRVVGRLQSTNPEGMLWYV